MSNNQLGNILKTFNGYINGLFKADIYDNPVVINSPTSSSTYNFVNQATTLYFAPVEKSVDKYIVTGTINVSNLVTTPSAGIIYLTGTGYIHEKKLLLSLTGSQQSNFGVRFFSISAEAPYSSNLYDRLVISGIITNVRDTHSAHTGLTIITNGTFVATVNRNDCGNFTNNCCNFTNNCCNHINNNY